MTDTFTPESIAELLQKVEGRAAKATPGPWAYMTDEVFSGQIRSCGLDNDDPTAFSYIADTPDERDDDMEFIASARTDVDQLCAALRWQGEEITRLQELCKTAASIDMELRRQVESLTAERGHAMAILTPNMPESGLEDACCQLKQAYISEADNAEKCDAMLSTVTAERDAARVEATKLRTAICLMGSRP